MFELILYICIYDIWYYFLHMLFHTKYLYFIHKKHHLKINPTYLDSYFGNSLEKPIQSIGIIIPFIIYPIPFYKIACTMCIIQIRDMMSHDESMIFLVGNHHLLHHKYPKYNFGEFWIDFLFGTLLKKLN